MAAATLSPSAKQFFWNVTTGAPLANGLVYVVTAGGSYPSSAIATYQDSNATILNANPIPLNAAGYATIYLQPGKTYKYLVYDAGGISGGTLQYSQDGIEAAPTTTTGLDAVGTAGDTFTIGQVGYLSDGSGGKTPGLFYLGDSANTYSSTLPAIIAVATSAIASGSTGVFRQGGIVAGLSGLTAGAKYYIGTAGALTATAPANSRQVGVADNTTTQLDVAPAPSFSNAVLISPTISTSIITPASAGLGFHVCQGRLSLTSGTPVTTVDVTAAVTIYFMPYAGNNIGLYDGSTNWTILPFPEISVAVGTLTNGLPYDLFAYNNSGAVALRAPVAWTNATTRATALTTQNGVLVKTGATTDRFLGTFTTSSTTTTEDSLANRLLSNYYNAVPRLFRHAITTASWTYPTSATIRQANAAPANLCGVCVCWPDRLIDATETVVVSQDQVALLAFGIGIGFDSTTAYATSSAGTPVVITSGVQVTAMARATIIATAGYHTITQLEAGNGGATATFYGTGTYANTGILQGTVLG